MRNIALLAHAPSERTLRFIRNQPGEWLVYQYNFHTEKLTDIEPAVIAVLKEIHAAVDLEHVSRIWLAPPGLGPAGSLMAEGIRGISGIQPEVLVLLRDGKGQYVPCMPRATIDPSIVYNTMRRMRSSGVLL